MELKPLEECTSSQREFIGSTFPTPKGGVLTVVGCCREMGIRSIALFKVECSICSKDMELFSDGFKSNKDSLVKGSIPCGCAKRVDWEETQYEVLVRRLCEKRNYRFLGWVGEFIGNRTKLHLHNLNNGNIWSTVNLRDFLRGYGCPVAKSTNSGNRFRKSYDIAIEQLTNICDLEGYSFVALPEYRNNKSKFKWMCNRGHDCCSMVGDFLSGTRCMVCKNLNNSGNLGFYKDRTKEQDYLYIYKIKGQPYIKVGRSFEPDRRLKENQTRINKYYGNKKHKIIQTHLFTGTHEEIYNLEQDILSKEFVAHSAARDGYGSSELLREDCYADVVAFCEGVVKYSE